MLGEFHIYSKVIQFYIYICLFFFKSLHFNLTCNKYCP